VNKQVRVIDVTAACGTAERISCAVTVTSPDPANLPVSPLVMFAWPGGGYNRGYFDLQAVADGNYSQAEFHAANGVIFVACDHVAVGDSTVPVSGLDHSDLARANRATAAAVLKGLRSGELIGGLGAVEPCAVVGMGQSYGGLLLTLAEAQEPLFDGVAMLGWSAIQTIVDPTNALGGPGWNEKARHGLSHPYRSIFHYDDVPDEIVAADLAGYPLRAFGEPLPPWGARWMPGGPNAKLSRGPLDPGIVKAEAAAITCAVFVGNGERDTCANPRLEPVAYVNSRDVTTYVLPRAAHMHNFAGSRRLLWGRLQSWASGLSVHYY
jgi:hypothetical protein